jgi:hypothetical protein
VDPLRLSVAPVPAISFTGLSGPTMTTSLPGLAEDDAALLYDQACACCIRLLLVFQKGANRDSLERGGKGKVERFNGAWHRPTNAMVWRHAALAVWFGTTPYLGGVRSERHKEK